MPAPPRIMAALRSGGGARSALASCDAAACARCPAAGGGSHAKHSNGLGSQIDRQREARPHPCQTQTKRSGELANQERKMRRSLRKTFFEKLLTVY